MVALLALTSAVCYGIVDFAGGLLSRHIHHAAVTFFGQLGGLLLACAAALLMPAEAVHTADLLWGALSGVGSGFAMRFLNRGLSRGAMTVVVPVSAVTGVALSVLCGVLVLGDRPGTLAWIGIAVTVPSLCSCPGAGPVRGRERRTDCSPARAWPYSTSPSARPVREAGCGPSPRAVSPPSSSCCRTPLATPAG
ncbi:EamA family transporter [Streptomyces sp. NPDC055506]